MLDQWLGVFAPAGTPADIIERLNGEIGKALADPAVRKNLLRTRRRSRSAERPSNSHASFARTTPSSGGW